MGRMPNRAATIAEDTADAQEALTAGERALVRALGFDPATHRPMPVTCPVRGIRVEDERGRPVRFVTEKVLRRDVVIAARWRAAWREERGAVPVDPDAFAGVDRAVHVAAADLVWPEAGAE